MNKYSNFTKYFNKIPSAYLIALIILNVVSGIAMMIQSLPDILGCIGSLVLTIIWTVVLFYFYSTQLTLERALIGRTLKKSYSLDSASLKNTLAQINSELAAPLYSDASNKKKYNAFFITNNWVVGTDGMMLVRGNAVNRANIVSAEKLIYKRKGYYYFVLQITDTNNRKYKFWLRSAENLDLAYDTLMSMSQAA